MDILFTTNSTLDCSTTPKIFNSVVYKISNWACDQYKRSITPKMFLELKVSEVENNRIETTSKDSRVRREEWQKEKEFEKDGIVVIVSKLPLHLPRYSIEIASRTQFGDQKIGRHFQVHVDRKSGSAVVSRIMVRSLVVLVGEAEKYIEDQEQLDINAFVEWKKTKEKIESGTSLIEDDDNEILIPATK